jgi:hypothetical protein
MAAALRLRSVNYADGALQSLPLQQVDSAIPLAQVNPETRLINSVK